MAAAQRTRRMVGGIIVAGWIALALAAIPCATLARTVTPSVTYTATPRHHYEGSPTPTPTQTPQRTGDLGTKAVHGRVYDTERGIDAGIAGATVSYAAPSGTGSVQTDGEGDFAFSLFLHDTDLVVVGAAAPGFHASEVRLPGLQLWFQSEIDLGLEPIGRTAFRIAGRVQRDPYCSVESPVTVVLDPLQGGGRSGSVELSATGDFLFEDVPDGDYTLRAESDCQPSYAAPVQVYVRGADVYTEIAFDALCPPVLVVDPPRGPPGTVVAVRGRCYYIHSGGSADVYLDRTLVTSLYGDTSGNYSPELLIPPGTDLGWHAIEVRSASGMVIGSAGFYVDEGSAACVGDCNDDARVDIDELIAGVRIALGSAGAACDGLAIGQGDAAIAQLVAAVGNALHGCPP